MFIDLTYCILRHYPLAYSKGVDSPPNIGSSIVSGFLLSKRVGRWGMIILATNRPFDLDEAMHRRITLAIEFQKPET